MAAKCFEQLVKKGKNALMTKSKFKNTLKIIFSMKTARFIGNGVSRIFKWLNVPYKAAMAIFGILTLLLAWGLYGSIMSAMALEGLVVLPLIGGIIKLVLLVGVVFGWGQFLIATRTFRQSKEAIDSAGIVYNISKKAAQYGAQKLKKSKEIETTKNESRVKSKTNRSSGQKYFR